MNVTPHLFMLEKAGLIQRSGSLAELEYVFRHGLLQEAAYATLLKKQREKWHLAVGEVLEAEALDGGAEALAPVLAHHFALGGDRARAVKYHALAGEAALARYANAEALQHFTAALDLARSGPSVDAEQVHRLFSRRGKALELRNEYVTALLHYDDMEGAAEALGRPAMELDALMARATIHATANLFFDPAKASQLLTRAQQMAQQLGDRAAEARILWSLLLQNVMSGGEAAERVRYGEAALRLARELDRRELVAYTVMDLWFGYAGGGQWDKARDALAEARRLWHALGNATHESEAVMRLSVVAQAQGDWDAAVAYADEAHRLAAASNNRDGQGLSRAMIGAALVDRGEFDTALTMMEAAMAHGEATGNVTVLMGTRADLAWAYGLLGQAERGLRLAEAAHALGREAFPLLAPWPGAVRVRLLLRLGQVEAARSVASMHAPYGELRRRAGFMASMWATAGLASAELALAAQGPAPALDVCQAVLADLDADGIVTGRAELLWLRGRCLLALGRLAFARAALQDAKREAQALKARRLLWLIWEALAEVEQATGQTEAAEQARAQADAHRAALRERIPTAELRESFDRILRLAN